MALLLEIADQFRRDLLIQERAAAIRMIEAYLEIHQRLTRQSDALLSDMQAARDDDEDVSLSWLYRQQRYQSLLEQTEAEINRYSQIVGNEIVNLQSVAVDRAQQAALDMLLAGIGPGPPSAQVAIQAQFNRVSSASLQELVGVLSDGSPLSSLLDTLGPETRKAVERSLITGVGTGQGSEKIAREIRRKTGMPLNRALRISRTETLRASRTATQRSYEANADVLKGWVWRSALGTMTCAACYAMHGSVHPVTEAMYDHPNGRCVPVPMTKSWAELGFEGIEDTRPEIERGSDVFDRLSPAQQQKILGRAKYQAYKNGEFTLADLAGTRQSAIWGPSLYEKSLHELVGKDRAVQLIHGARPIKVRPSPTKSATKAATRLRSSDAEFVAQRKKLVHEWVHGSNRKTSVALKESIKRELNQVGDVYSRRPWNFHPAEIEALGGTTRRMYEETQAHLRAQGITEVTVFRGIKQHVPSINVVESWTDDRRTATKFNGYRVIEETVPASRVFMYYNGPGWKNGKFGQQYEYMILGNEPG